MRKTCMMALALVLALMVPLMAVAEVTYPFGNGETLTIARQLDPDLTTAGYTTYNDAPGIIAWEAATGINLEFVEPADETAYLLYLASGNIADIVMGSKNFYPGGISAMVSEGLARDLTDLLPEYAPDYWALVNSNPAYLSSVREPDGRYYAIGGYFHEEGTPYRSWIGLVARQEFLDQLGMEAPTTLDELYTYLSRCKAELGVETPFMSDEFRLRHMFDNAGALTSPFGLVGTGRFHVDGEVHYGVLEPEYKDFLAWLNKLYEEGLMDPNFAVTDEATAHAAFLSGQSALIYTAASRVNTLTQAAASDDFTLVGLSSLKQADGSEPLFAYMDAYVSNSFFVYFPEDTPEETVILALQMFNYLYTKEGMLLSNFGEEGVTYDMVDGQPILNEYMTANPDGLPLDGLLRVHALMNYPLVMQRRMSEQRFPLPQQRQAIEAWAVGQTDLYKINNDSIAAEFSDEYAALFTDIDTYIKEARAQFISGAMPIDDFDTVYIPTLESMGSARLMEIYQASYDLYNQ